jgi:hypothetical protein
LTTTAFDVKPGRSGDDAYPVLSVEAGGRVLRGLALPFDSPAYVLEGNDVIEEIMDQDSLDRLPGQVPLLQGHDRVHPAICF